MLYLLEKKIISQSLCSGLQPKPSPMQNQYKAQAYIHAYVYVYWVEIKLYWINCFLQFFAITMAIFQPLIMFVYFIELIQNINNKDYKNNIVSIC